MLVQAIHKFADRDFGVIAVQQINVQVIGLEPVQALDELRLNAGGCAEGGMGAFADDDDLLADAPVMQPLAHRAVAFPTRINPRRIKCRAAALKKTVK